MEFKEISSNDYPLFHDLLNDYYREGEDEWTEQEVIDSFIKLLFDKVIGREIDCCIVKENGEALGFALWAVDREGFDFSEIPSYGTVLEIGIVKQYRNRRYGVKLMSHIEDKLLEKGITDCYVSAYGPAQAFWSRCGFEDSGRIAGNGLPIMTKSIKKPENSRCIVRQRSARDMLTLWGYKSFDEASPTARYFYDNIESGNAIFWSLCNEGNIVGELYSFLELEDKDFADGMDTAYLCALRVKEDHRGKGYGSILMNTALSDLKSKNFSFATIGVGMDEEKNQKMYEHMGFNRKVKECFFDPCARDKDMKPSADEGFILLSKKL